MTRADRLVTATVVLATGLGLLHHVDHAVRGDAGWPVSGDVNAFTYSLLMYPVVAFELYLAAQGRRLHAYRMTVAVVGFTLVAAVHFGPVAADPLDHVYASYGSPVAGGAAVAAAVALLASLILLFGLAHRAARLARKEIRPRPDGRFHRAPRTIAP
jgi:hypothetical protein